MRVKNQRGGFMQQVLTGLVVDVVKDTAINIIKGKVKKQILKSKRKGKPITPKRVGVMIGKRYLAHKYKRDKRTRQQKIADRAGFAGKMLGKGTYKMARAMEKFSKGK